MSGGAEKLMEKVARIVLITFVVHHKTTEYNFLLRTCLFLNICSLMYWFNVNITETIQMSSGVIIVFMEQRNCRLLL